MTSLNRLTKELDMICKIQKSYFEVIDTSDIYNWKCKIILPEDCKYSIKIYNLHIKFTENYPFTHPYFQFLEKIEPEHEYIDNNITICGI